MDFFRLDEAGVIILALGIIYNTPKIIIWFVTRKERKNKVYNPDDDPAGNDNINRDFWDYM